MAPLKVSVPTPVLVSVPLPEVIPDKVSCVPSTFTVLAAARLTEPDKLLVPVDAAKVPLKVNASEPTATFCRSRVAPLATVVPAAVVPKPASLLTAKVPALTVVGPV